jgi:hypothetical protein
MRSLQDIAQAASAFAGKPISLAVVSAALYSKGTPSPLRNIDPIIEILIDGVPHVIDPILVRYVRSLRSFLPGELRELQ